MAWEEQASLDDEKYWKPENEGDSIEGNIVEILEGNYGPYMTIETEDEIIKETPAHKDLQNRIRRLEEGDYVKITLRELKEIEGREHPMRLYWVQKWTGDD